MHVVYKKDAASESRFITASVSAFAMCCTGTHLSTKWNIRRLLSEMEMTCNQSHVLIQGCQLNPVLAPTLDLHSDKVGLVLRMSAGRDIN
jgi:hypothetical protein